MKKHKKVIMPSKTTVHGVLTPDVLSFYGGLMVNTEALAEILDTSTSSSTNNKTINYKSNNYEKAIFAINAIDNVRGIYRMLGR